jgi:hypothetical protein
MYYIGLDVHKRTISYCVKDAAGKIHQEGKIGSTRRDLDSWIKTLPQPRIIGRSSPIWNLLRIIPKSIMRSTTLDGLTKTSLPACGSWQSRQS